MANPRCTERVPEALGGDLTPLPQCSLRIRDDGTPHEGLHRANRSLIGVGKVIFRWHGKRAPRRPVIVLPTPTADHIRRLPG